MSRTANVFTRVEPTIKAQAEAVLEQLGISMSTAMEIYLRQIALQRKIPFELKLPNEDTPISLATLTDDEFNALMNKAAKSYSDGLCTDIEEFKMEMNKEFGI